MKDEKERKQAETHTTSLPNKCARHISRKKSNARQRKKISKINKANEFFQDEMKINFTLQADKDLK